MTCQQCGKEFESEDKNQKYCSCECAYINFRVEKKGWFAEKRINPNYLVGVSYENKR